MTERIKIENNGPYIVATNYFEAKIAGAGYVFVSRNERCFRLLINREYQLQNMRTGKSCEIEHTATGLVIWFLDGTDSPYRIEVSNKQCDRLPPESDKGRDDLTVEVWTNGPQKRLELSAKLLAAKKGPYQNYRSDTLYRCCATCGKRSNDYIMVKIYAGGRYCSLECWRNSALS